MMQNRLRFLLLLLMAAVLVFSCASSADAVSGADENLPEVEITMADETDASASGSASQVIPEEKVDSAFEPSLESDLFQGGQQDDVEVSEGNAVQEAFPVPSPDDVLSTLEDGTEGTDASEFAESEESHDAEEDSGDSYTDEQVPDFFGNEFIPVEDETAYVLDVSSYYDDFSISDDDFVAIIPDVQPEEPAFIEDASSDFAADTQEIVPAVPEQSVYEQEVPVLVVEPAFEAPVTDFAPVMEPVSVPPVRENMKKPVVLVTEDEAARVNEQENEVALAELEDILDEIPEPEEPAKPAASRSVVIHKNDILEIPYQGNWWVYLGDVNNSGVLVFSGRDFISEKTVFTLRAVKEGGALLHFFKQDIIGGVMVDDYLEVIVEEACGISEKVELEMFVISQVKPVPTETDESYTDENVFAATDVPVGSDGMHAGQENAAYSQGSSASGKTITADDITYVQLFEEPSVTSDTADAVSVFESVEKTENSLPAVSPAAKSIQLTDAEIFAKAQEMEATDIESAVELYEKLVAEYPASPYWNQANKRLTYINRFYFFKR